MTIGLSLDPVLSRVQIALSGRVDGTVLVERSTTSGFQKPVTVRGGVALPVSGGVSSLDDYEFFVGKTADIENFYRVTPVDPAGGLLLDGSGADFASAPDTAALDITGDIVIIFDATMDDWTPGVVKTLVSKFVTTGDQRSYQLFITAAGDLRLSWSTDGTSANAAFLETTNPLPFADGERKAIRVWLNVDNGAGNHSLTVATADTAAGPFEDLESVVGTGTTSIHAGTADLKIGTNAGNTETVAGTIHSVVIRDGSLSGTIVADPDFGAQAHGDTSFADDAGLTWTVSGDATINGFETDSITPSLGGKLWFKSIRYPGQNFAAYRVIDRGGNIGRASRDMLLPIEGRMLPTGVMDFHGGRGFVIPLQAPDQDAADRLDLVMSVGREWFIHVPPELHGKVPGGYVAIGIGQQRPTTQDRWVFALECHEISPPGPDMVGTTLTGDQLVAMHGDVNSVWAAYPTVRDMWNTVGGLEDLVI